MKIATPEYVLRNEGQALGVALTPASAALAYQPVFGFSDKPFYDDFASASELPLMPYPMVKGYLKNQMAAATDKLLNLVIVDALGPATDVIYAATMDVVMRAYEMRARQIVATHVLRFDPKQKAYELEEISV